MVQNKGLILTKVPNGMPIPGQDLTVESCEFNLDCPPPAGGVMTKNIYASYDPYLRTRMNSEVNRFYFDPFVPGRPIESLTIAKVLKSDSSKFSPGQLMVGLIPVEEYSLLPRKLVDSHECHVIQNPYKLDIKNFLGPLGMPGLTAYASLYEIGKPKKGETIFISAASGAVGQILGQLAKREGLRVIGSVGSDEKLSFILDELKFDGGFNYKVEKPIDALKRLAPKGVDIYYDNVGGEQLDAALGLMNRFGRIVACGMISDYNKKPEERYGIKNLVLIIAGSITMRGFLISDPDMGAKYFGEANMNIAKWLSDGSITSKVSVTDGIDNGPQGFVGMMEGKNFGKAVLKIADE